MLRRSILPILLLVLSGCAGFGPTDDPNYKNIVEASVHEQDRPIIAYSGVFSYGGAYPSFGQAMMLGRKVDPESQVVVFTKEYLYRLTWRDGKFDVRRHKMVEIEAIRLAKDNSLLHRIEIDTPNLNGAEFQLTMEFMPSRWTSLNPGQPAPFDLLRQMVRPEVAAAASYDSSYTLLPPPRTGSALLAR